jgi:hypothetical protein
LNALPAGTIFALKGQHILACRNAAGNRTQKHNALKKQVVGAKNKKTRIQNVWNVQS